MIVSFSNQATEDVFDGKRSKRASKACPASLWRVATRKLDQLNQAELLDDLQSPPGNRLERLKGNRSGQHSIRINDQFRVCFVWTESGPDQVEITDYH
ncbi:MAG: type II toxin-antitoxin system RelE/ParE family toxin [Bacteroidetes bacterium]|nr:type II toxin-antitoxin system RelE/ParE family toxin [Bacteroidota bacterium]